MNQHLSSKNNKHSKHGDSENSLHYKIYLGNKWLGVIAIESNRLNLGAARFSDAGRREIEKGEKEAISTPRSPFIVRFSY